MVQSLGVAMGNSLSNHGADDSMIPPSFAEVTIDSGKGNE